MAESLCIVAVVERGRAEKVIKEIKKVGAKGATILYGRGTGEHEALRFFDIQIESSKEIILVIMDRAGYRPVWETMIKVGQLKKPGKGIIFTFPIENLAGLKHRSLEQ